MRCLNRTVRPHSPEYVELALELTEITTPGVVSPVACPNPTPAGSYWPLGGSGNTPNPSDGVVYYLRGGIFSPIVPTPGHQGSWHFPIYSAGGEGQVDYAGDHVINHLRFVVVGDGTMTIHTEQHMGAERGMIARVWHAAAPGQVPSPFLDATYFAGAGDDFVIPVTTHGGVNCVHWVNVSDNHQNAGGKWGWSGMDWETE
jgi:hypothetical protein